MSTVMIKCPSTGKPVSTGIEVEPETFEQLPDALAYARCPYCGLNHSWWKREAWLDGHAAGGERELRP